ncbi:MAG: hypothetical protein E6Q97_03640 [Desulfurellales bacterium]|nr:MAG: hypothetical protein E6Q97_03640 [Desulfurellales bacterium]
MATIIRIRRPSDNSTLKFVGPFEDGHAAMAWMAEKGPAYEAVGYDVRWAELESPNPESAAAE